MDWIESLCLGLVQGLTEFLPISSDGHLAITALGFEHATGRSSSPAEKLFFNVMLHVGTLLAIVLHYRQQAIAGAKGLLGSAEVAEPYRRGAVIRVGLLAVLATVPLVPDKLFFMDYIERAMDSLTWTGIGFLVTAAILLLTIRLKGGEKGPSEMTWLDALLVGVAQMFAPLPGVSRSGLTISAALALGFSKTWAVNFSLMMAVPAILGATASELKDVDLESLTPDRIAQIVASAAVAGVVGYLAIVWLVRIVRSGRLWYFSVYLVMLGLALIALDARPRGTTDARPSHAPDRPARLGSPGSGDRPDPGRPGDALARPFAPGSRSGDPAPGGSGERQADGLAPGLDLG